MSKVQLTKEDYDKAMSLLTESVTLLNTATIIDDTPPVDPPVDPPPTINHIHSIYDKWSTSQFCLRGDTLRKGTNYYDLCHPEKPSVVDWVYDEAHDAAMSLHRPVCRNQLRLLLDADKRPSTGNYTAIIPIFIPLDWSSEPSADFIDPTTGQQTKTVTFAKLLQLAYAPDVHYLEFRVKTDGKPSSKAMGGIKYYGSNVEGTYRGPGDYNAGGDAIQPMTGPLDINYGIITYLIQNIDFNTGHDSVGQIDSYSLWTIAGDRTVQVHNKLPFYHPPNEMNGIWIQFGGEVRGPNTPVLNRFVWDILQLKDAPIDEVLADYAALAAAYKELLPATGK